MALIGEFGAAVAEQDPDREPDQFKFYGELFTVADRVGSMPLLRFAAAAASGADSAEQEGLAAMHDLLRDCLSTDDWRRFQQVAQENKADGDELLAICRAVYQALSGRPTRRPSDSSDGPSATGESSKDSSSSVVNLQPGQGPIMADPRVRELQSVTDAGKEILGSKTG